MNETYQLKIFFKYNFALLRAAWGIPGRGDHPGHAGGTPHLPGHLVTQESHNWCPQLPGMRCWLAPRCQETLLSQAR